MKVSMKWISQYAEIPVSPAEYESRMIMTGTGVEGMEDLGAELENVVVGKVLTCRDHENSDHLHVCTVDVGENEPLQIVCGAPNVEEGILVPVAKVGAKLPGGVTIKKGKLRCYADAAVSAESCIRSNHPSIFDDISDRILGEIMFYSCILLTDHIRMALEHD